MTNSRTPLTTTAKLCIFFAGFSNFLMGYALYFVMYDTDREKASWFRSGARAAILGVITYFVVTLIVGMMTK